LSPVNFKRVAEAFERRTRRSRWRRPPIERPAGKDHSQSAPVLKSAPRAPHVEDRPSTWEGAFIPDPEAVARAFTDAEVRLFPMRVLPTRDDLPPLW